MTRYGQSSSRMDRAFFSLVFLVTKTRETLMWSPEPLLLLTEFIPADRRLQNLLLLAEPAVS